MKPLVLAVFTATALIGCEQEVGSVSAGSMERSANSRPTLAGVVARLEALEEENAEILGRLEALEAYPSNPTPGMSTDGVEMHYATGVCSDDNLTATLSVGSEPIGWHVQGSMDGQRWTSKYAEAEHDPSEGTLTVSCGGFPGATYQLAYGWRLVWWAAE